MNTRWILIPVLFAILLPLNACSSPEEKAAHSLLEKAHIEYTNGAYDIAIQLLDSIHMTYPTLIKERQRALALSQEVKFAKSTADSARVAPMLEEAVQSLEKMHRYFSELSYPDLPDETILRYKGLDASSNPRQPFLDAYLEHNGRLQLIAGCASRKLQRIEYITALETRGDTYVSSDTIPYEGGRNYRFTSDNLVFERLTLSTDAGKRIAAFIATIPISTPIRVTFFSGTGEKKHSFVLSQKERTAIKGCYDYFSTYVSIKDMEDILNKHEQRRLRYNLAKV